MPKHQLQDAYIELQPHYKHCEYPEHNQSALNTEAGMNVHWLLNWHVNGDSQMVGPFETGKH